MEFKDLMWSNWQNGERFLEESVHILHDSEEGGLDMKKKDLTSYELSKI